MIKIMRRSMAVSLGLAAVFVLTLLAVLPAPAGSDPLRWAVEWPDTDFSRHSVDFAEILSGGPPKDGIPSIDDPQFVAVDEATALSPTEPLISLVIDGEARAYPLRILMWHEIVNDTVAGVPVAITYCPLCNSGIVFDRRLAGRVLEFGTTGKLRHSDMVMYDRQTESWWQQFLGEAIVGELTGERLAVLPARLESFQAFADRHPDGQVLVPSNPMLRDYGRNPYAGYDRSRRPMLYRGEYDGPGSPLMRVVAVGDRAWSLELLRREGRIEADGLILTWTPGQASALDRARVADGRDVGNVVVQWRDGDRLVDVAHDVPFAFAFAAFHPGAEIRHADE